MRSEIYHGEPRPQGYRVTVTNGNAVMDLPPRFDLWNHSPTGFCWGYGGSGPAQLALAILAYHFRNEKGGDQRAVRLHQDFKWQVIAPLDMEKSFTLHGQEIALVVEGIESERDQPSAS